MFDADCRANWMGKLRTAISFPAACVIYVYTSLHPFFLPQSLIFVIEGFLIFINIWSLIIYTRQYMPYLKQALHK